MTDDDTALSGLVARILARSGSPVAAGRPVLVAIAGGVGVGKSHLAETLADLIRRTDDDERNVEVVATDGFLLANSDLERRGLIAWKGFPETYDHDELFAFLVAARSGQSPLSVPRYSHVRYDRVVGEPLQIVDADVLLIEGLSLLQPVPAGFSNAGRRASDLMDLNIYVEADDAAVRTWWIQRFLQMRDELGDDPESFLHQYAGMDDESVALMGDWVWDHINGPNLAEHIAPSRAAADVVVSKGADHRIVAVDDITGRLGADQ